MPELPDVEIFKQYFQATALHQKIKGIEVPSADILEGISAKRLRENLSGKSFSSAGRHGKYLFAEISENECMILHFGMTGFLKYYKDSDHAPDHPRLLVHFSNGFRLAYDCRRKLGRIGWTADREGFIRGKELGPDPLAAEFGEEIFLQLLEKRRGSIKGLLMNQQALAGIGNVYSDEILFQAGIHPRRQVSDLREKEKKRLLAFLEEVLHTAIEKRLGERAWPDNWLLPRREPGAECPRCGAEIERISVSGRNAYCCCEYQP